MADGMTNTTPSGPLNGVQRAAVVLLSLGEQQAAEVLKHLGAKPWWIAALVSWGIALAEYLLQVPANRIGYATMTLAQLKVIQEVITLVVFVPFAAFYMQQPLKWDYLWAGLCLMGAVYFVFRN